MSRIETYLRSINHLIKDVINSSESEMVMNGKNGSQVKIRETSKFSVFSILYEDKLHSTKEIRTEGREELLNIVTQILTRKTLFKIDGNS